MMTIEKAYDHINSNWNEFVEEMIEENLDQLLENEGVEEEYDSYNELPEELSKLIWNRQAEHISNEINDYASWYAGHK